MSVQASTHLAVINPAEEVSKPTQSLEDACCSRQPAPAMPLTCPCPNLSPGPSTPGKVSLLTPNTTGVLRPGQVFAK